MLNHGPFCWETNVAFRMVLTRGVMSKPNLNPTTILLVYKGLNMSRLNVSMIT